MLAFDDFGPAERLHAALRRRAPQMAVSIVRDGETELRQVRVTYRFGGPVTAGWDGSAYRVRHGDGPWTDLPADPERAAEAIADALGARTSGAEPPDPHR